MRFRKVSPFDKIHQDDRVSSVSEPSGFQIWLREALLQEFDSPQTELRNN